MKNPFYLIVFIAAILRIALLWSVPPSPSLDEVSIGYNAYSILHTGKDEYGYSYPLLLRAYDDWRPGLYVYLVIPFIKLFGLNVFSVRLPSVILSISVVVISYFFSKELLKGKNIKVFRKDISTENASLLTALLLAISPWHIYISRLGHEANLGLFTTIFGLYFLVKSFYNHKLRSLLLAMLFNIASLYSYQSQKLITPFLVTSLSIIYFKEILKMKKTVFICLATGIVLLIPFILISLSPNSLIRLKATNVFEANSKRYEESAKELLIAKNNRDAFGQIIHNRRMTSVNIFLSNYISHFNPVWLFTNSGKEPHKVPNMGLLYVWEAPFIILGIIVLLFSNLGRKEKILFFLWIFSSPLAAGITTGAPHAMRSYTFLPSWQIMSALGLVFVCSWLNIKYLKLFALSFFTLIILISVAVFSKNYFIVFPKEQSSSFQYPLKNAMLFLKNLKPSVKNVYVSNNDALYQSYMFYLFNSEYDPQKYLKNGGTRSGGFNEFHKIDNISFGPFKNFDKPGLYFINPEEDSGNFKEIISFKELNDVESIRVIEVK